MLVRIRMLLLITIFAIVACAFLKANAANQNTPAGMWKGNGHAKRHSDLKWVDIEGTYDSDFWFTIDQNGNADGYAIVTYSISLDDRQLSGLLSLAHSNATATLSLLGTVGTAIGIGASIKDITGMTVKHDEPMPVRSGRITGTLRNNVLTLNWATAPAPIPYKTYKVYPTKQEVLNSSTHPAYSPWIFDAEVQQMAGGNWYALVSADKATKRNEKVEETVVWSATKATAGGN